jgi:transcriptional regulator with XRE-family HTH domain
MEAGVIPKRRRVKRTTRATPTSKGRSATPGAVLLSDVVARNVRAYRRVRDLTQDQVAAAMSELGHGWSGSTLSFAEKGDRTLTTDELFALAIVLETDVLDLLDPTGIDKRQIAPVDYGRGRSVEHTLPATVVKNWLRGAHGVQVDSETGSFKLVRREGHDAELEESNRAMHAWLQERHQRPTESKEQSS